MKLRSLFLILFILLPSNLLYQQVGLARESGRVQNQSEEEALRLHERGKEALRSGKHREALSYFEEALKIYRKLKSHQDIAAELHNIGTAYAIIGSQHKKALSYLEEALKIYRDLNIPEYIVGTLETIGIVYASIGQYEKTLPYTEEALKIYRDLNIPEMLNKGLNNIGLVYAFLDQYEMALSYLEEALKISRELKSRRDIAAAMNNIGFVYHSLDQHKMALSYLEEALKISRELNIPQGIAGSLGQIGSVYSSLGQYDKALTYLEEALKISRELKSRQDIAADMNNIGVVYRSLGQHEKALSYFEEALNIFTELNIPSGIDQGLNNIGGVYLSLKQYKKAERVFIEAAKEREKIGIKWIRNTGLVEVYLATGRHGEALKLLKEMPPEWNVGDLHLVFFHTQNGLALKGSAMPREASYELFKAVSISEEMRQKIKERTGFFVAGVYGGHIRAYRGLVAALSERTHSDETVDEQFTPYGKDLASCAFYFSEATKARTLLEAMTESARKREKVELLPEIRKKEEGILHQLSAIENRWEETYRRGEEALRALVERKGRLRKELDSLVSTIRKEYPKYAALNYPRPIPPEELPLKENEVLLEYAIGDDASYLFRVKKGGIEKVLRIPAGKEELEKLVNEFMLPFQDKYTIGSFSPSLGQKLYGLLLGDVLKDLSPEANIIIVPDGILGLLPFEALVTTPGETLKETLFVNDRWNISYYQSATVLALMRALKPSQAVKPLFALGDPIYDKEDPRYIAYKQGKSRPLSVQNLSQYAYRGLATRREYGKTTKDDKEGQELIYIPLPETEMEVRAIAGFFDVQPAPPDVLLNIQANETNLRKVSLKNYQRLHFATHADLPGKVQGIKEPFILLGQVENAEKDDGFLTFTEVLDLSLDANLVVLSACLTGRGKAMEGEGVMNFARAFHHAGAQSVVVSLWEVASDETVEYMKLFYQHLKEGKSKAEALSLAKKEMKAKYPNPYFWSPFILHGER